MPLDLDPNIDLADAKPILLAGKSYHVAPLPLRQVLAIVALLPTVNAALTTAADGFDEEKCKPMLDVICRGLKRTYPGVTADDILDLPTTIGELMEAVTVVVAQGGGKKQEDPAAGE